MTYYCQNFEEHGNKEPVEVTFNQRECHECNRTLDWDLNHSGKILGDSSTAPVFPKGLYVKWLGEIAK